MKQIATKGIVLNRIQYGEGDRILTWLTSEHGKLSLIAKGVRKERSKLAGGIELFSEANISFVKGRGEVGTLTSTRLLKYYEHIVKDLERTKTGFEFLKTVNKTVESEAGEEWYKLVKQALGGLDDLKLPLELTELWFSLQWLKLSGHSPNLQTLANGGALTADKTYEFSFTDMAFLESPSGPYAADHIKLVRLAISVAKPQALAYVQNTKKLVPDCVRLVRAMLKQFVSI